MIGQVFNKDMIEVFVKDGALPRFIILVGPKGSGKKTFANFIAKTAQYPMTIPGKGVDDVRETIKSAYMCSTPIIYLFPDVGNMSTQAKNAMLKVTEEPPKHAYFIVTAVSLEDVLDTLSSRGIVIPMERYSRQELANLSDNEAILSIASNPGEIEELLRIDFTAFIEFANSVLDNIGHVTGVNAFKIATRLNFTDDESDKYNPELFLSAIMMLCYERLLDYGEHISTNTSARLRSSLSCTSKFKRELAMSGIRKDATIDMWILAMRDIWCA